MRVYGDPRLALIAFGPEEGDNFLRMATERAVEIDAARMAAVHGVEVAWLRTGPGDAIARSEALPDEPDARWRLDVGVATVASNPTSATADTRSAEEAVPETMACRVAKVTVAEETPGTAASAACTVEPQFFWHIMPSTRRVTEGVVEGLRREWV